MRTSMRPNAPRCALRSMLTLPVAAVLLSACGTTGLVTDNWHACVDRRPILISKDDRLTEGTAQQIEAANETGKRLKCPGFIKK